MLKTKIQHTLFALLVFLMIPFMVSAGVQEDLDASRANLTQAQELLGEIRENAGYVAEFLNPGGDGTQAVSSAYQSQLDSAVNSLQGVYQRQKDLVESLDGIEHQGTVREIQNEMSRLLSTAQSVQSDSQQLINGAIPFDDSAFESGIDSVDDPNAFISPSANPSIECPAGTVIKGSVCLPTSQELGIQDDSVTNIVSSIVLFLASLIGFFAILMIVAAGIMYIVSAGDQSRVDLAKRILTYAIVGLVVALLAWVIVNVVSNTLGAGGASAGGDGSEGITGTEKTVCVGGVCTVITNSL